MHPGALATEIQFTAWRAKEGRFETRTRTVTKIHSGTKQARLQVCSSRLRNLGEEESGWWQHGGAAGCEQLQSSVFPPSCGRVETTTTRGVSGKRATKMDTDTAWKMLRHGTKY